MTDTNTSPKLRAVMLDWAGTTVDHGSRAPVFALQALFEQHGIRLSIEQARRDMGLLKRDHIRSILMLPDIQEQWRQITGYSPTHTDVEALFQEFGPLQLQCITKNSQLIEGVAETVRRWQIRGLRIGTTTGYTRAMLNPVLEQAKAAGYSPDASVSADEVPAGRPAPWMLMRNAQLLDVYPPRVCVKIGDTIADIEEGLNAGMWTIGLTRSGNMVGLDASEWSALHAEEKSLRLKQAEQLMLAAGAHMVAEDLAACDPLLFQIDSDLRQAKAM
jgi:phosphonoacetaldehyde hydrolase